MEGDRVKAAHVNALRHTANRSLSLLNLTLQELYSSFEIKSFDQGCLAEDFTCRLR